MGEAKTKRGLGDTGDARRLELQRLFERLRINSDQTGFYDDPAFIAEERRVPLMLENYGEWVMHRERNPEYDAHLRGVMSKLAPIIFARLDRHQWFGG